MLVNAPCARDTAEMESDAQPEPAALPKLKRRWLRFSTRALLVVVTVLGVTLGVVGRRVERQRQAVKAISAMGGIARYADYNPFVSSTTRPARSIPRIWVEHVASVDCRSGEMTDAGMVHLAELTRLESICLDSTQVSDAGLVQLNGLRHVKWLSLTDTRVSDAGLVHLKELTTLHWLWLDGTQVSDAGEAELRMALPNCIICR
jgi:hypothetical protein